MSIRAVVQGIGHATPEKVLTNADLEKMVETSNEWIVQRTGISERRILSEGESNSTLAIAAAKEALADSGLQATDLDAIIVATVTEDMNFPSTACLVQHAIGARTIAAFDLGAACAGSIYAVATADAFIQSGMFKTILVIGVDTLTQYVDWTDRGTCVLFGDAAAAFILSAETNTDRGVIDSILMSDGSGAKHIQLEAGGSLHPMNKPESAAYKSTIHMAGSEVYRFAVNAMADACNKALEQAKLTTDDIDLFVPHQANRRIIDSAAEKLGLSAEKVFLNVHKYGNTSAASIPLGLYEAVKEGRLKQGDVVMTVGFGAGLVWGANIIRW